MTSHFGSHRLRSLSVVFRHFPLLSVSFRRFPLLSVAFRSDQRIDREDDFQET